MLLSVKAPPMFSFQVATLSTMKSRSFFHTFRMALAGTLVLCLFYYLQKAFVPSLDSIRVLLQSPQPSPQPCQSLPGLEDLFVVLRTGANEAPRRLPVHFDITLRCVPNYVIYSDFEEDIDGHHVFDVLSDVNETIKVTHPDFVYYNRLQEKGREDFSDGELAQWSSAASTGGGRDTPGWKLDKWKFLPMLDKAFNDRPDAKWYVFIEGDSYISWAPLLNWLSHIDATKEHYMGMPMQIGDVIFAYGGAGVVISRPALQKLVEHRRKPENLASYDDFTANHWAGDCVLGKAMRDVGVDLFWASPNFWGGSPADLDLGNGSDDWCYNVVSYHHMDSEDVRRFSEWEREWYRENNSTTMRQSDVFRGYVLPHIQPERLLWDNKSDEQAHDSTTDECRSTCESQDDCVMFSVSRGTCKTSTRLRLGHPVPESSEGEVTSGWMMERVAAFVKRMDDESCLKRNWKLP